MEQGFFLSDLADGEDEIYLEWTDGKLLGSKCHLVNAKELLMARYPYTGEKVTVGIRPRTVLNIAPLVISCTGATVFKIKNFSENAKVFERSASDLKLSDKLICFFHNGEDPIEVAGEIIFIKKTLIEHRQIKVVSGPADGVVINNVLIKPITQEQFKAIELKERIGRRNGRPRKAIGDLEEVTGGDSEEAG